MMIINVSLEGNKLLAMSVQPAVGALALKFLSQQWGRCACLPPSQNTYQEKKGGGKEISILLLLLNAPSALKEQVTVSY